MIRRPIAESVWLVLALSVLLPCGLPMIFFARATESLVRERDGTIVVHSWPRRAKTIRAAAIVCVRVVDGDECALTSIMVNDGAIALGWSTNPHRVAEWLGARLEDRRSASMRAGDERRYS